MQCIASPLLRAGVLQQEYARVFEVVLMPGESTLFRTHSYNKGIDVQLSEAVLQEQFTGKEWEPASKVLAGAVSYGEGPKTPYTHRVRNIGSTVFREVYIELLQ